MPLELKNVTKRVGAEVYIYETNLVIEEGTFNILLGSTLAGKTTLMRLMAGIQTPTSGSILNEGKDVTGVPVQKRNVSMVYQQFINYPNFSVYENIASPLRVAGLEKREIDKRVRAVSDLLRLTPMLDRRPMELSGGQQQRTAIARAIVEDSDLILLDEPLANLDYKLREEMRDELPKLFIGRKRIVVYATTDPTEALLFGGNTATLHEGQFTQFGPTSRIYRRPSDVTSAKVFSDPPLNTAPVGKRENSIILAESVKWPAGEKGRACGGSNRCCIPRASTPLCSGSSCSPDWSWRSRFPWDSPLRWPCRDGGLGYRSASSSWRCRCSYRGTWSAPCGTSSPSQTSAFSAS
jgi:glycerol transport system ATP-binding protein